MTESVPRSELEHPILVLVQHATQIDLHEFDILQQAQIRNSAQELIAWKIQRL